MNYLGIKYPDDDEVLQNRIDLLEKTIIQLNLLETSLRQRYDMINIASDIEKYKSELLGMFDRLMKSGIDLEDCFAFSVIKEVWPFEIDEEIEAEPGSAFMGVDNWDICERAAIKKAFVACNILLFGYSIYKDHKFSQRGGFLNLHDCLGDVVLKKSGEIIGYWTRKSELKNSSRRGGSKEVMDRKERRKEAIKEIMIEKGIYNWPSLSRFRKEKGLKESFIDEAKKATKLDQQRIEDLAREILEDKKRSTV